MQSITIYQFCAEIISNLMTIVEVNNILNFPEVFIELLYPDYQVILA
jgi:hypothetical protein